MPQRFFILLCVGVIAIAVARQDKIERPVVKQIVVERVMVKEREVKVPGHQPDGYMTEDQCNRIALGTDFRDLIFQYGWPAGDDGTDSYAGYVRYPLSGDHGRTCDLDTFGGEVTHKEIS